MKPVRTRASTICEPHWKTPPLPFADLLVFQTPSTETTYNVLLTLNATPPVRKTSPWSSSSAYSWKTRVFTHHLVHPKSRANNHLINHYSQFTCTKTWGNAARQTPTLQEKHPRKWIQIAKWKRKKYPNMRMKVGNCCSRRRRHNVSSRQRRRAQRRICDGGSWDWTEKMRFRAPKIVFAHKEEDESISGFKDIWPTFCFGSIENWGISTSTYFSSALNTRGNRVQIKRKKII